MFCLVSKVFYTNKVLKAIKIIIYLKTKIQFILVKKIRNKLKEIVFY